jgi:large conductance mechanosensitive channel
MLKGFRDFILRGNVVDLAVAVIIGAAFTGIVNSLVGDVINPLIAAVVGKPNFSYLVLTVNGGKIMYGNFLNAVINFLLVAFAVYFAIVLPTQQLLSRLHLQLPISTKKCPQCLSEIPAAATRCSHCAQPVTA